MLNHMKTYTEEQLVKYGLAAQGWTFRWNTRKRAYGVCDYQTKTIELSRPMTEAVLKAPDGRAEVVDTVLHEIAHALAGYAAAHGPEWRRWCRKIGANPTRTTALSKVARDHLAKESKYTFYCKNACGYQAPVHRRLQDPDRYFCPTCRVSGGLRLVQNY